MILEQQKNRDVIDLIRALAIFLVVAAHAVFIPTALMPQAAREAFFESVASWPTFFFQTHPFDMIFVLSGFLLCTALFQEHKSTGRISIRDHFVRRLSRVLPLYYIAILFYGLLTSASISYMIQTALFISAKTHGRTLIPVGWSAETMMQAYLVLPFMVMWVVRSSRPVLLMTGMVAAALAARLIYMAGSDEDWSRTYLTLLVDTEFSTVAQNQYRDVWFRIAPFIMGMGLAWAFVHRAEAMARFFAVPAKRWSLLVLGLVIVGASYAVPYQQVASWPYQAWGDTGWLIYMWLQSEVFSAGQVILLACAFCWPGFRAVPESIAAPSRRMSKDIFGLYLFHWPFILIAMIVWFWTTDVSALASFRLIDAIPLTIMSVIPSILFAYLVGRYLERPALSWLRKRLG